MADWFLTHGTFMGTKYLFYSSSHITEDTYSMSKETTVQAFVLFRWCYFLSIKTDVTYNDFVACKERKEKKLIALPCPPNEKHWSKNKITTIKTSIWPWPVGLSWLECHPVAKGLWIRFPGRAHAQGAGSLPHLGMYGRQPTDVSLPLSLPLSLKAIKKCPQMKKKQNKQTNKTFPFRQRKE